jgi:hypothetical protein
MKDLFSLENRKIRISIDRNGRLVELINLETGHNYAGCGFLWKLIYQDKDCLESEISAKDSVPAIELLTDKMSMIYGSLLAKGEDLKIKLKIEVLLDENEVHWNIELENNEDDLIVSECHFPNIDACDIKEDQALLWAQYGGQIFKNPRAEIAKHQSLYMAKDYKGIEMSLPYNAFSGAATNCFLFMNDSEGLYFGSHDPSFQATVHLFRLRGNDIDAGFIKYPFLKSGEKTEIKGYVISPYSGTWHAASKKYRKWADSWLPRVEPPGWVKRITGWQRIILKHQYGEIHYRYEQLPEILEDGMRAGVNTLLMFGWHKDGMDNKYPEYECDEAQGGKSELAKRIAECQEKGGKVILYFNGRLIDKSTDYYKEKGRFISIKDIEGNEVTENYKFGGDGTALRLFGYKSFVAACPSSEEWFEELKRMVDQAVDLGVDGVFFDQTGHGEVPCYDKSHGHPVPFTRITACKANLMKRLREYIKSINSELAIGNEVPKDIVNQYADFVHSHEISITDKDSFLIEPDPNTHKEFIGFIEWYRYTFPEFIFSDREIRDDTDIERRVNYTLTRGLRNDVEIYRCRKTIKETPRYERYLNEVNRLKNKYQDLLLLGKFDDECGIEISDRNIEAKSFISGNKKAIVATQSKADFIEGEFSVPGDSYVEHDGIGDFSIEVNAKKIKISLRRNAVAVIVMSKSQEAV